jgi:hypothetical protein
MEAALRAFYTSFLLIQVVVGHPCLSNCSVPLAQRLELLGATVLFCQVGVIDMGSRIGYSKNNVVGYVVQNEVSLTHGRVGCWYSSVCLRVVHCTQAYYHRTAASTTVIRDVVESKRWVRSWSHGARLAASKPPVEEEE